MNYLRGLWLAAVIFCHSHEHDLAPEWLQKSWHAAQLAGLDQLSADEIDAEISGARKARRESRLQPGS